MNKNKWVHTVHKPIKIEGKKGEEFCVQCSNCGKNMIFPTEPPPCQSGCLERMDLCKHGVACQNCSKKLMLEWIREGNMKVDDTPQLESIKKMIWETYKLEVYVNEEGYLAIKE